MENTISTELLETVNCPLCDSSAYDIIRPAFYPHDITREYLLSLYSAVSEDKLFDAIVRCRDCSLIYLNPRVHHDIILESYAHATQPATDPTFVRQNEYRVITFRRNLRKLIKTYGIVPNSATKVLDIGCASGAFPKAAQDLGFSVIGVEPNHGLADRGRKFYGLDIRTGYLEAQGFGEKQFDLITIWDVIEHLTNPQQIVKLIHNFLKDDGILVVNFPNHDSFARKILGWKWPMYVNVHLLYFTPATMTHMLNAGGFEVLSIKPFCQTLELGYTLKRAGAYFSLFNMIEKLVAKTPFYKMGLTYNIGQSLLVARKKR
jgi:2-polyprenyl-3-methyl-5-hydroxy-6-metoxy-1,4-benzoquinol methylase